MVTPSESHDRDGETLILSGQDQFIGNGPEV